MTKDELVSKLQAAVGGTPYGDELIKEAAETFGEEGKYAQDMKDRLDDRLGILEGWIKKHDKMGEEAKAVPEEEKVAIVKKALDAIK